MINLCSASTPHPHHLCLGVGLQAGWSWRALQQLPSVYLLLNESQPAIVFRLGASETVWEENVFYFLSLILPSIQSHWRGLRKWGSFDVCQLGYTDTRPGKGSGWPQRVHVPGEGPGNAPRPCSSGGPSQQAVRSTGVRMPSTVMPPTSASLSAETLRAKGSPKEQVSNSR